MGCKKWAAEFIGTFWLVLAGCGAAVIAGSFPGTGIGFLGISIAFGWALATMAYAIGPISGCHVNPAVTLGLVAAGKFDMKDAPGYIVSQVLGAIFAAWVLMHIAGGKEGFDVMKNGLGANGFGAHSPGGYSMHAAILCEIVMTAVFMFIILSVTDSKAANGMAPMIIGITLALIHLITIPVTGTSVNPARSAGPAIMMGGWAWEQLWVFWVAPIVGAIAGAIVHRELASKK